MSAKKGAPALYELYHSGKTPRKGLFSKSKPAEVNLTGNVKDIPMARPQPVAKPTLNVGKAFAAPVVSIGKGQDNPVEGSSQGAMSFLFGNVSFNLPVWLLGLICLSVIFTIVAAYSLGNGGGKTVIDTDNRVEVMAGQSDAVADDSSATAVTSPEMQAAVNSDSLTLITGAVRAENRVIATTDNSNMSQQPPVIDNGPALSSERPARCLIVYGDKNLAGLEVIRNFFQQNGLSLDIAKRGSEFVLVTREGFSSTREPIYKALKDKIQSVGEKYIVNRPEGGLRISLATFRSSYPIDTEKLNFTVN